MWRCRRRRRGVFPNRELKQRRRQRQRKRHKTTKTFNARAERLFLFIKPIVLSRCRRRRRGVFPNRELKQRRRQRQRKRHKTIGLMNKNNRSARALNVFVHFFAVISKTAT